MKASWTQYSGGVWKLPLSDSGTVIHRIPKMSIYIYGCGCVTLETTSGVIPVSQVASSYKTSEIRNCSIAHTPSPLSYSTIVLQFYSEYVEYLKLWPLVLRCSRYS